MERSIMLAGKKCHSIPIFWFVFLILTSFLLLYIILPFLSMLSPGNNIPGFTCVVYNVANSNTIPTSSQKTNSYFASSIGSFKTETNNSASPFSPIHETVTRNKNEPVYKIPNSGIEENLRSVGLNITKQVTKIHDDQDNIHHGHDHLDSCSGRYIYVHNLPSKFNEELLKHCKSFTIWYDFCPYLTNMGFGPKVSQKNTKRVLSKQGWFNTNQFSLEVIFHNKMRHYKCLTNDSSSASAIFVPFYAGLDLGRFLWGFNTSMRDNLSKSLVSWLRQRREWEKMWGRDHFLVGGRVSWDFRRATEAESEWGSKLMSLPESKNMTFLTIESSLYNNDFAIPYPTYFYPSKDREVFDWQKRMRATKRPHLFSFAGAPRPHLDNSIRGEIIAQCLSSGKLCKFLSCYADPSRTSLCDEPLNVMKVFERSVFCLQPSGDTYTRTSTFDSILAGCIPVFFNPGSAYKQYLWHFPGNQTRYSVFIPESDVKQSTTNISETLRRVPKSEVLAMREEVIKLIPRIIYANPKSSLERFEDAFDIAVKGVLERVEKVRKKVEEGMDKDPGNGFA